MSGTGAAPVRSAMRAALSVAIKKRDRIAVNAIRSALAAIDNAEAVESSLAPLAEPGTIAGGVHGLARGEVPRRTITDDDARAIVRDVITERRAAAAQYDELQRTGEADRLRAESAVLARFLEG
jgi:uncharacterized protein YqeY